MGQKRQSGYCLVTPGGGGGSLGLGQVSATHPPNPTPPPRGGGSMPSTHNQLNKSQRVPEVAARSRPRTRGGRGAWSLKGAPEFGHLPAPSAPKCTIYPQKSSLCNTLVTLSIRRTLVLLLLFIPGGCCEFPRGCWAFWQGCCELP